MIVETV